MSSTNLLLEGTALPYVDGGLRIRYSDSLRAASNPGGGEIFRAVQIGPEAHVVLYTTGNGSFQEVKRPKHVASHPPSSSAGLQIGWRYASISPLCLHRPVMGWSWQLDSSCNVMAHGDAREGKWRGNWRMEWVASTLHTTSEHAVSSITTADAHTSAASSRLNWRPRRLRWTRPFHRKTKSGFCACAITFQTQSTLVH
jgi:hypothetical protein